MIDTANILALYQPLCMMQLLKTNSQVMPVPGGYFGVPWLLGIQEGEFSEVWGEWNDSGQVDFYVYQIHDPKSTPIDKDGVHVNKLNFINPDRPGMDYQWVLDSTAFYGLHPDYQNMAVLVSSSETPINPDGSWGKRWNYSVWIKRKSSTAATFRYLGRAADGMPYHFQTAENAQAWIDATAARDAAARPKTGAARDKKLASMLAYKARVQKSRMLAADRAFLNADLKSKVLDMLLREINEASRRLALI